MENAPASSPAIPVSRITLCAAPVPATPMTRAVLETSPSLTPNTPARSAPDRSVRCHRSRRPICCCAFGRPPSMSLAIVRACPCSSAAIPGAASGSWSYMLASARSPRSISGRTRSVENRPAAAASSRVRRLGRPGGGTSAPAPRSLPSQCAACRRSTAASSSNMPRRSPVSAAAIRVYSAAASRSPARSSRQRLTCCALPLPLISFPSRVGLTIFSPNGSDGAHMPEGGPVRPCGRPGAGRCPRPTAPTWPGTPPPGSPRSAPRSRSRTAPKP